MGVHKDFTKRDLVEILDIIQASVSCRTESDVIAVAGRIKELVCADMSVCALAEKATGRLLRVTNHNWPDEWAAMYVAGEFCKMDPVFLYSFESEGAYTWAEASGRFPDKPYSGLMDMASEFRLRHGISGGISSDGPKGSIFSFAGDRDRFHKRHLEMLDILTPHMHQALVRTCRVQARPAVDISSREREVLSWMREGKTNWEISVILGISERTVKFHVQNIERKLNAVNKAHAIAIALDSGLVA